MSGAVNQVCHGCSRCSCGRKVTPLLCARRIERKHKVVFGRPLDRRHGQLYNDFYRHMHDGTRDCWCRSDRRPRPYGRVPPGQIAASTPWDCPVCTFPITTYSGGGAPRLSNCTLLVIVRACFCEHASAQPIARDIEAEGPRLGHYATPNPQAL